MSRLRETAHQCTTVVVMPQKLRYKYTLVDDTVLVPSPPLIIDTCEGEGKMSHAWIPVFHADLTAQLVLPNLHVGAI